MDQVAQSRLAVSQCHVRLNIMEAMPTGWWDVCCRLLVVSGLQLQPSEETLRIQLAVCFCDATQGLYCHWLLPPFHEHLTLFAQHNGSHCDAAPYVVGPLGRMAFSFALNTFIAKLNDIPDCMVVPSCLLRDQHSNVHRSENVRPHLPVQSITLIVTESYALCALSSRIDYF